MKKWEYRPDTTSLSESLAQSLSLHPLVIQILVNRGYSTETSIKEFLENKLGDLPSPFLLRDMQAAVDRIFNAIQRKENIVVYGDYDVDGTVSSSLLLHFFNEIGYPLDFYVPHRMKEGYSLNNEALDKLKKKNCHLIITVDNGISAKDGVAYAQSLGMDVIVTDHHEVPAEIPQCVAVIDPLRAGCDYPDKYICGAGVAFNLMMALRSRLRDEGYFAGRKEPNLKEYLDLLALATVADVVPLVGVNRIFVRYGLQQMMRTKWIGLRTLMEVSQVGSPIQSHHLGFRLGPRINACGRLYDAAMGIKLLTTFDEEEAKSLANQLDRANQDRKIIETKIKDEAIEMCEADPLLENKLGIVLYKAGWHPGVLGIVASRLAEKYARPAVLLGDDEGGILKGSARSYGKVDLIAVIRACDKLLLKCGGHKAAAGLSLKEEFLSEFKLSFDQEVKKQVGEGQLNPYLMLEKSVDLQEIDNQLIKALERLEPFGQGNPEPLFSLKKVQPIKKKIVGQDHLKFEITDTTHHLEAIGFGMGKREEEIDSSPVDLAFSVKVNEFRGQRNIVLHLKDFKK